MPIIKYEGSQFLFNNPAYKSFCQIDSDFKPTVDIVNDTAKKYQVFIYTTSSFRMDSDHIKGAVVVPATKSDHFVGHALDYNIFYKGKIYNHNHLDNFSKLPLDIQSFIKECEAKGVRSGRAFKKPDSIHFDDDVYHKNPQLWEKKYKEYHP